VTLHAPAADYDSFISCPCGIGWRSNIFYMV